MSSSRRPIRFWVVLVVMAMTVGALAVGPVGAEPVKAPVGAWSGVADSGPDDFHIVAIDNGPVDDQPAFWAEAVCGPCEGPCGGFGPAWMDGGQVFINVEELVCFDTGEVPFDDFTMIYDYDAGSDELSQGSGDFVFTRKCGPGETTHLGTAAGERIVGTAGNDVIDGRGGNDTIIGKGGWDILCGAGGNDLLKGGSGVDILLGGPGKDKGFGGTGWDFLVGAGGKDVLKGQAGTDFLIGGSKKDKLIGGGGPDDYADGRGGPDVCNAEIEVSC